MFYNAVIEIWTCTDVGLHKRVAFCVIMGNEIDVESFCVVCCSQRCRVYV